MNSRPNPLIAAQRLASPAPPPAPLAARPRDVGRFAETPAVRRLRLLFAVLNRTAPGAAARLAYALLTRPPRVAERPWQRALRASARHNIAIGLWLRGAPWRAAQARALQALRRVQLADVADRGARGLSGGQQQRLALARAWAQQPQLLLLDEPTASLDPHAKHEVEALMQEFSSAPTADSEAASAPLTMLFASHNLGQVKRLARRVVYLEQGRVLADLPTADFFNRALLRSVSPQADWFLKGELS